MKKKRNVSSILVRAKRNLPTKKFICHLKNQYTLTEIKPEIGCTSLTKCIEFLSEAYATYNVISIHQNIHGNLILVQTNK